MEAKQPPQGVTIASDFAACFRIRAGKPDLNHLADCGLNRIMRYALSSNTSRGSQKIQEGAQHFLCEILDRCGYAGRYDDAARVAA